MGRTKEGTTVAPELARALEAVGEKVPDRRRIADRREAPRIRLPKVDAEIVSLGLPATVLEVGFGGLSIVSAAEFSVGEVVEIRCSTAKRLPVVLRVEARHCRPEGDSEEPTRFVTGFQFIEAWSPGDGSAVDALIERIIKVLSVDTDR